MNMKLDQQIPMLLVERQALSEAIVREKHAVVIDEVGTSLFIPHLTLRANYHSVKFLSQIHLFLKGDGPAAAKHLIDVYFALFNVLITEAESTRGKEKSGKGENIEASWFSKGA